MSKLTNFSAEKKQEFKSRLENLNAKFDDNELYKLIKEFIGLTTSNSFTEIESWLLELLQTKKLLIVNGLLAAIYCCIEDFENAKEFALKANKAFPDTEIFENIIKCSIWNGSQEEQNHVICQ